MVSPIRVYTTDYGQYTEASLPPQLAAELREAVFRKDGYIDRRFNRSRAAWVALQTWARLDAMHRAYEALAPTETPFHKSVESSPAESQFKWPEVKL